MQFHLFYQVTGILLSVMLLASCGGNTPQLTPLSQDATILAFGDSLTYGTGAKRDESYPSVLERLSGRTVINAGIPGEISAAGLERLPDLLNQHQPDLLILCHGGNDMLRKKDGQQMLENLRAMIRAAQSRQISVVLISVPKPALFLNSADGYGKLGEELNIPVEDEIVADILADSKLKSDAIHPNSKGYRKLAEAVYALLRKQGAI